jgi:acyl carrier protein
MEDIINRLNVIFRRVFEDESIHVTNELTASDVKNWDSLSHIAMITAVEREFRIKFKLKELVSMKNVGDLIRNIAGKTIA